jgi:hypothetical protein
MMGRFIACTNQTLALYSTNFELQREKKLEPSGPSDFWSMQRAGDSDLIFLRHESHSQGSVVFSWLNGSTLEVASQLPNYPWVYQYKGMGMQGPVKADSGSVFGYGGEGLRMIDSKQQFKTVCGDPICRAMTNFEVLSTHEIAVFSKNEIGVVDSTGGVVWKKSAEAKYPDRGLYIVEICPAMLGERVAAWINSTGSSVFDGVNDKSGCPAQDPAQPGHPLHPTSNYDYRSSIN